jgi:hypothetical protein
MCKLQSSSKPLKNLEDDDSDPISGISSHLNTGNLYYNALSAYLYKEKDPKLVIATLNENISLISNKLSFSQRKNLIQKVLIRHIIEKHHDHLSTEEIIDLIKF